MHDYEIRVVARDYRTAHTLACSLPSDFAAIRRGQALAQPGEGFEVWRDGDCIYANHRDHPLAVRLETPAVEALALDYEIRILRDDLSPSLIWKSIHTGDSAAIRAGMRAAAGHPVEVWRDMDCIFRTPVTNTH